MIAEFSIIPVGKGESLSADVAQVLEIVRESGLAYDLGPMGTSVEGEWDVVMALVKKCRDKLLETNNRIHITVKIDDRKGTAGRLKGKVESVESRLGKGNGK